MYQSPICSKCGSSTISASYHKNKYECHKNKYECLYCQRDDNDRGGEHLHYRCLTCGYTWTGSVLNQRS